MPSIEELLRASLSGANDKYDKANDALHATVAEAAKAVGSVTSGKLTLRLVRVKQQEDGTRYRLVLSPSEGEPRNLASFFVPQQGFPIRLPDSSTGLTNPEAIAAFFQKLASDPSSPLVAYLAFQARHKPEEGEEEK